MVGSCLIKTSSSLATTVDLGLGHWHLWDYNRTLARVDWFRDIHLTQWQPTNSSLGPLNLEMKTRVPILSGVKVGKYQVFMFLLSTEEARSEERGQQRESRHRRDGKWIFLAFLTLVSSATPVLILLANTSSFSLKLVRLICKQFTK